MSISAILALVTLVVILALLFVYRIKLMAYIVSSRGEMKKVVFPTRERVLLQTRVVLVSLVITAFFFGGVDFFLTWMMGFVFS
jgi:preprotein translocase subunit SecE